MKLQDRQEEKQKRWTFRAGYTLFLALLIPFFVMFLYPLPSMKENRSMMNEISQYNVIFKHQNRLLGFVDGIKDRIVDMDFSVQQVQKVEDIKSDIIKVRVNNNSALIPQSAKYNEMASNVLQMHFECREILATNRRNLQIVQEDLDKCQANIPEGSLTRAPY